MRTTLSLAALLLIPSLAFSQNVVAFLPEPDFELSIGRAIASVKPADAFASSAECAVVDARFIQPVPIEQAEKLLGPCLSALSARYGADLAARRGTLAREGAMSTQVQVLKIIVPQSISQASPVMRDLNESLKTRNNRLLGHAAIVERAADRTVNAMNTAPAQKALDDCMIPTVVRKIESGADFIKYYGSCLAQAARLRIVDMRQSEAHKLGVVLVSGAERPVVAALTGPVSVIAANGMVQVQLLAYANPVYLR